MNNAASCALSLCKHVPHCGGCKTQQIDYAEQLQRKQESVKKLFNPAILHEILPCPDPWRYRNKMEYSFSQNKAGEHFLGLMIAKSRGHVFNLEECYLTAPWFAQVLGSVRTWWKNSGLKAYHPYSNTGSLRTLTLREGRRTGDKMAILTVSGQPEFALNRAQLSGYVQAIKSALPEGENPSIFLRIQQIKKGTPTQFYEMLLSGPDHISERLEIRVGEEQRSFTFKISPTSFFQPNPLQAELLYARALEMCALNRNMHVLDLYCGTATLGMIFASQAGRVSGIELCPEAVLDAESNLRANGIENVEVHQGDVGKILQSWKRDNLKPDLVIVDPPRAGLDATSMTEILQLAPKEILYISCNPETQAQNVKSFLENGYKLLELQPVDQFPHTPHLETIARLVHFS